MSKAFSSLLKHIDKLSHTDKERLLQWVKRYVEPSSTVGGRLIEEMREVHYRQDLKLHFRILNGFTKLFQM